MKLAQAGFGQAVILQTFVRASDKTDGATYEEEVVVKFTVS